MTNKINGIDVSEWELKGVLIPITECKYFEGIGDCKETKGLCIDNEICYFKQLKRLQEENDGMQIVINNYIEHTTKYRQALEEIRERAQSSLNKADSYIILKIINEVLNENS